MSASHPNRFTNHYQCPCGCSWHDDSPHTNDDRCPRCGTACQPEASEDIEQDVPPDRFKEPPP
ncbi:MAG: hypothetical protein GXY83_41715 [Rhodopirellula sp.]|nr:hypothetical protein [Rhodopirellula sp.]